MGARPEKAPRCSAKIGTGMVKKQAQRDARALANAVAAGLVRVKGMGKKRQAEKGEGALFFSSLGGESGVWAILP